MSPWLTIEPIFGYCGWFLCIVTASISGPVSLLLHLGDFSCTVPGCPKAGDFPRSNSQLLRDGRQWIHSPAFPSLGGTFLIYVTAQRVPSGTEFQLPIAIAPHKHTFFGLFLLCLISPFSSVVLPEITSKINYICSTACLLRTCFPHQDCLPCFSQGAFKSEVRVLILPY